MKNSPRIVRRWINHTNQSRYGILAQKKLRRKRGEKHAETKTVFDFEDDFYDYFNEKKRYDYLVIYEKRSNELIHKSVTKNNCVNFFKKYNSDDAVYLADLFDYCGILVCFNDRKTSFWLSNSDSPKHKLFMFYKDKIKSLFKLIVK